MPTGFRLLILSAPIFNTVFHNMSAAPHLSKIASDSHNVPVYDSRSKAPNKQSSRERRNKRKLATAVAQTSVKLSETKSIDLDRQLFDLTIQTRRDKSRLHCLLQDNSKLTKQAAILRSEIARMHSHLDGLKSQIDSIAVSPTSAQQTTPSGHSRPLYRNRPVDRT